MTKKEKALAEQVNVLQSQLTKVMSWIENSLDFEDFHNHYLREKSNEINYFKQK